MWRSILLLFLPILHFEAAFCQPFPPAEDRPTDDFDRLVLTFNGVEGKCFIQAGTQAGDVLVERVAQDAAKPKVESQLIGRTKKVAVNFEDNQASLSSCISERFFNSPSESDYEWKVHISDAKPIALDLNYALGDSHIDLSGLAIEQLKLHSGSANVSVLYEDGKENRTAMDTFLIKLDMGSFKASNIHLSKSENLIADVGFGTVFLDFQEAQGMKSEVTACVGVGKLEVVLPGHEIPIRINLNESPLSRFSIPKGFSQAGENSFTNYTPDDHEGPHLTFHVDVAVGSIIFRSIE
jgi:hypothetical protein